MFQGYNLDRQPPYSQEVYFELNGIAYMITYYVCKGYGDSVSITSSGLELSNKEGQKYERSVSEKSR